MKAIARILVVDDDEGGRYALAHCLSHSGYQVIEAQTGAACLNLARSGSCDLVLLDVQLPDMLGFDVCTQLKSDPLTFGIPVIQVSAHFRSSADRTRALQAGADAYITTPFEPAEVLGQVGALLRLRKAELALRESEQHYRLLFEKNPDAVFSLDPQGRFTLANPACERISGFSQVELLGKNFTELCHPSCREAAVRQFHAALAGAEFDNFEMTNLRKDGTTLELAVSGEPVLENGRVVAVYCAARDITASKRPQQDLRRTKDLLKGITEATQDLVAALDKDFRYLAFNERYKEEFRRIFGPEISIGTSMIQALAHLPEDQQKAAQMWGRALAGESFSETVEFGDPRRERKVFQLEYGPILDDNRNVIAAAHIVRDITEKHRVEERLRSSEEQLRIALASGNMGTWSWDLSTNLIQTDALHRALWEIDLPGPLLPADLFLNKVHPEDIGAVREHLLTAEGRLKMEFRIIRRDGQIRWLRASATSWHDDTGKATRFVGIDFDITDRKEAEAELERLVAERTAKLRELIAELEHYSYSITHDMRAPLRAMRGFAEVLREHLAESGDAEAKLFINKMVTAATRMDLLITDALNYNKTVRQELQCEPVDVHKVLLGMLDTYPEFLAHIDCIHVQGKLPVLLANEAALIQCFSNLIGNALKFVQQDRPPNVRIWAETLEPSNSPAASPSSNPVLRGGMPPPEQHAVARSGKWARLNIQDNGIGIPESMMPTLFSMFNRGPTKHEGTGIGLALVRKVIHRMGGEVGVESIVGKGSRFWFELPIAE